MLRASLPSSCQLFSTHDTPQRSCLGWRRWRSQHSFNHITHSQIASSSSGGDSPPTPIAAEAASSPATPDSPNGGSRLDTIEPTKLKELRRAGLGMADTIKMGRKGVAEGFIIQVYQRWNSSEVAKLYCHGKPAVNMKLLMQQLEERTGGIVVHKSGGSVFLYRGEPWPRQPPPLPAELVEEAEAAGVATAGKPRREYAGPAAPAGAATAGKPRREYAGPAAPAGAGK